MLTSLPGTYYANVAGTLSDSYNDPSYCKIDVRKLEYPFERTQIKRMDYYG